MKSIRSLAAAGLLALASPSFAGVFTDDLSRCLVDKTTSEDKSALAQWIFVAMAQHPSVVSMTKITPEQIDLYNKQVGELFMRLLTESCVDAARKAIKNEGPSALQTAFQVLGQAASIELIGNPDVMKVMSGLEKFLDSKKLEALGK